MRFYIARKFKVLPLYSECNIFIFLSWFENITKLAFIDNFFINFCSWGKYRIYIPVTNLCFPEKCLSGYLCNMQSQVMVFFICCLNPGYIENYLKLHFIQGSILINYGQFIFFVIHFCGRKEKILTVYEETTSSPLTD